jgi:hypothetical protein
VEVVEVEDIDAVVRRKSMLASAVFVIASSIESPVNVDAATPSAGVSGVDITSIYQIRHLLSDKDFQAFLCFPVRAL